MTKQQQLLNHPKKNSKITVDPIRSLDDIKEIKELLQDNPLYSAIFALGINTALRASDLIRITVGQVFDLKPMDEITLKEQKTGKFKRMSLNQACVDAINNLLANSVHDGPDDILFKGQRGPLTVPTISRLVKEWCRKVGLKGNFAAHTMRKTFCYHQYRTFGIRLPHLMKVLNHSSERQTMAYIGIQEEEVKNIYANQL